MHAWDELLTLRVVRRLGEIVNRRWRLAVGFVDATGRAVPVGETYDVPRPLCDLLREGAAGRASCASTPGLVIEVLRRRTDGERIAPEPFAWRCHAGLEIVAAPVLVDGELLGAVYAAGAFRAETVDDERRATVENVARFGFDEERVVGAASEMPVLTEEARGYLAELTALVVREILEFRAESARRVRYLEAAGEGRRRGFEELVGESRGMNDLFDLVEKVSQSDTTVLVTGENGTGKELVARAIHDTSPRALGPFVVISCSAFNENLLDSELFGHRRGAFTGAVADKKGLFEVADRGTLFLDEIGETPPSLQVKLLRVLQEGTFLPVGATTPVEVDVRIVAATNRDLKAMVATGLFREDLYYRIHVISLEIPPLRDRLDDLPILVAHFLSRHARDGRQKKRLTERAYGRLMSYRWPGNVRELENEIERLVVLSGDTARIEEAMLSERIRAPGSGGLPLAGEAPLPRGRRNLPDAMERLERQMLTDALDRHDGNRTRAARELGVSRRNLIRKIQRYALDSEEVEP